MSTTKVDGKTAQAILSNLAAGLRPFLTLARTALRDDHNNIYREAVRAVADGQATETIVISVNAGEIVCSLVLLDPRSTLPQPLFSMSAKGMSGDEISAGTDTGPRFPTAPLPRSLAGFLLPIALTR